MDLTSSIAASRLVAQERATDLTAANIANADTPGYKAARMLFSDWLSHQDGTDTPSGGATIAYTQDRATWRDQAAGPIRHTGNPLDLAISDAGWFTVGTARGPRLTRDGRFGLLPDGSIANTAGDALLDTSGRPVRIATTDTRLSVAGDGTLSSENGQIARIGVVQPQDPMKLVAEGGTLFRSDSATAPVTTPKIVQGAVEGSNVQAVTELTRLIDDQRQFQFIAQFVQAESDRQKDAVEKILPPGGA
ncbi:MAG TPA: flagellar hook basal-body protein [Acetobacteraceae bacterium]|nr:flagellar hook basal-body protein [Acetobacteraceae bacterium]